MRILHFSDFHLEKKGIQNSITLMDRMMDIVRGLNSQKKFDLIIFSGDMLDQGGRSFPSIEEGYKKFHEIVIERFCRELEIDESKFIAVPGNHEVNRKIIDRKFDIELENSLIDSKSIHAHLIDLDRNRGFDERLQDYDKYYRQPWIANLPEQNPIFTAAKLADHIVVEADGRRIGLSLLNSAWRCGIKIKYTWASIEKAANTGKKLLSFFRSNKNEREPENRVILGPAQITDAISFFNENETNFKFAIAHHHYSLLGAPDSSDSELCIRDNYNFCFWGHTHHQDAEESIKRSGTIISATAPGMIRWNVADKDYTNGFSVWDLDFSRKIAIERQWKQDRTSHFIQDKGDYEWNFGKHELIVDFEEYRADAKEHHEIEITSSHLDAIATQIFSNPQDAKILYGISGIGKSHLLRNILDRNSAYIKDNYRAVYYCERGESIFDELRDRLIQFFRSHRNEDEILVLDNSNYKTILEVLRISEDNRSKIRIIGVINSIEIKEKAFSGIPIVEMKISDIKEDVNNFIDDKITDLQKRDLIKRFSDGFPKVAIKLVEMALDDKDFNLSNVHGVLAGLYDQFSEEVNENEELLELLKAMALFQPFPKLEDDSMALWRCQNLSSLYNKPKSEIIKLIDKACKIWNGELIESSLSGYSIRPYSLAIRLAEQWFVDHSEPEQFEGLLEEISDLPPAMQPTVISCLIQRLSNMHSSQAAKDLFERLTAETGVFRSENVVLSDLGSQLILAASNVNPPAIASSIRSVLESKTSDEIKHINYFARRNLVFALSRLIYYPDSFDDALMAIALLAVNETEDRISNNSKGIFEQVFHVVLSGTSVNLSERIRWIKKAAEDKRISSLVPFAIKSSLAWGNFMRTGEIGAENDQCKDYQPSNLEIKEYWEDATRIALEDIEKNGNAAFYSNVISNNLQLWVDSGVTEWVFPLIKSVAEDDRSELKLLEYEFDDICHRIARVNKSLGQQFEALRKHIVTSDFISKLKSRQQEYYLNSHSSNYEDEIDFFMPLAKEFIENGVYKKSEELSSILTTQDFHCWAFCAAISESISDKDLYDLYACVWASEALTDDIISPFLMTFCSMTRKRGATKILIDHIYDQGLLRLYTRLMARTEDEKLTNLANLESKPNEDFNFLPIYLDHVSLTVESQDLLLDYLNEHFDSNQDEIISFVIRHYSITPLDHFKASTIKSIIMKFQPHEDLGFRLDDLVRFVIRILKYEKDVDFASHVFDLFLNMPEIRFDTHAYSDLYEHLIREYPDAFLEKLIEKMADARPFSIEYRLRESLGSGYGFAAGPLFTLNDDLLKKILEKQGIKTARMFASSCPVFGKSMQFSDWIIFLLDHYGNDKEVLDNLSQNLGSFSWTGSLVPLLEKKIKCFEKISNHQIPEVNEWAASNLKFLRKQKTAEETNEDFLDHLYR